MGSALVQILVCRLIGAKPLFEPVPEYCQLVHWEKTSVKFSSKSIHFLSRKCIWKYHLRNGGHFVQGEMSCDKKIKENVSPLTLLCWSPLTPWYWRGNIADSLGQYNGCWVLISLLRQIINNIYIYIFIYIYINLTVFVNVTTKSAQHAHTWMIAIIVEKSPNTSHMYDHGFMDNTNRQAVKNWLNSQTSDASLTLWSLTFFNNYIYIQKKFRCRPWDGISIICANAKVEKLLRI